MSLPQPQPAPSDAPINRASFYVHFSLDADSPEQAEALISTQLAHLTRSQDIRVFYLWQSPSATPARSRPAFYTVQVPVTVISAAGEVRDILNEQLQSAWNAGGWVVHDQPCGEYCRV